MFLSCYNKVIKHRSLRSLDAVPAPFITTLCVEIIMSKPPKMIDGAEVLEWAWSGEKPFGVHRFESGAIASEIYGLAICRYSKSGKIYRFSCNADWETEQDSLYESEEEAKTYLPSQYQQVRVSWFKYE